MEPNPYEASVCNVAAKQVDASDSTRSSSGIVRTTTRRIALTVFSLPLLLAIPVWYWAFHVAGSWFVSTDIEPDQREMFLGLMYQLVMAAITAASVFPGLLLLFIDNYRRKLTGCLMIPALILFIAALLVFASMTNAYIEYS
jgi:hypothetical protein